MCRNETYDSHTTKKRLFVKCWGKLNIFHMLMKGTKKAEHS